MKKGLSLILLILLLAINARSQHKLYIDLSNTPTIVNETDSFVIDQQYNLSYGLRNEYTVKQYSKKSGKTDTVKTQIYGDNQLKFETIYKNGKPFVCNRFSHKHGRLSLSCEVALDTIQKRKNHEVAYIYRINGIAKFYDKKGRLDIAAIYSHGTFKQVLFYRNRKILNNFLNNDYLSNVYNLDNPFTYQLVTYEY